MRPVKLFFYFNGFNSAILDDYSGNAKIVSVAEFAESRGYHFMPVSICYRQAREHAGEILAMALDSAESVFCGSSMGGWFARILQMSLAGQRPEIDSAAVAFNPAFDLSMYGHMLVGPQRNHVTFEEYEWTRSHSDTLRALESAVDYRGLRPFFVYVDRDDELINWQLSEKRHSPISRFIAFDGGCHSFDHYREALADFDQAYLASRNRPCASR